MGAFNALLPTLLLASYATAYAVERQVASPVTTLHAVSKGIDLGVRNYSFSTGQIILLSFVVYDLASFCQRDEHQSEWRWERHPF